MSKNLKLERPSELHPVMKCTTWGSTETSMTVWVSAELVTSLTSAVTSLSFHCITAQSGSLHKPVCNILNLDYWSFMCNTENSNSALTGPTRLSFLGMNDLSLQRLCSRRSTLPTLLFFHHTLNYKRGTLGLSDCKPLCYICKACWASKSLAWCKNYIYSHTPFSSVTHRSI